MTEFAEIWSYLAAGPLLWLTVTLAAYVVGDGLAKAARRAALANPVLIAVILVALLLRATETPYATYFEGAQFVHFMLGPATVALAAPLYFSLGAVRRGLLPILVALVAGAVTAMGLALGLAMAFELPEDIVISLAPKSTTAPVAIGVAEATGGSPTLTAVLVILTGVIGAVAAGPLLTAMRIRDPKARGLAIGVASHGIGAARAFQESETAGAFAAIGLGLNAVLTTILAPLALALLFGG